MKSRALFPFAAALTLSSGGAGFAKTLTVTQTQIQNWQPSATGTVAFVAGPAPAGAGALVLDSVDSASPAGVVTTALAGVKLRDLRTLKLDVQYPLTSPAPGAALLQIDIDYDLKDGSPVPQGRLVCDLSQNASASIGTWQTRDAVAGKWSMTAPAISAGQPAGQPFPESAPGTLAEILARFPNAGVPAGGQFSIRATGNTAAFRVVVDSLTVRHKSGSTVWNFEPDSDADGLADSDDTVPLSDRRVRVDLGTGPTSVVNSIDRRGASIQDRFRLLLAGSLTPAKFLKSAGKLTVELTKAGTITKQQQHELTFAAGLMAGMNGGTITSGSTIYVPATWHLGGSGTAGGVTVSNVGNWINSSDSSVGTTTTHSSVTLSSGSPSGTDSTVAGSTSGTASIGVSNVSLNNGILTPVLLNGGSLIKQGTGSLVLSGTNTLTDATSVAGGTLQVTAGNAFDIWMDNSADPISGTPVTSNGLNGLALTLNGLGLTVNRSTSGSPVSGSWLVTNAGSTGNDVRLTYVPESSTGTLVLLGSAQFGGVTTVTGGTLQLAGSVSGGGWTILEDGTLLITSEQKLTGDIVNNGTIRVANGAKLDLSGVSSFTNNGVLDAISGSVILPATMISGPTGRILDSTTVKITSTAREGTIFRLTVDGYTGHSWQLQRSDRPDGGYVNIGSPQAGSTGSSLTFTSDEAGASRAFFRIVVDP